MESSDSFYITFKYNHPDHELVITSLLSDFTDYLEDDFQLYIYDDTMILLFKNLYWIYEIHHKLSLVQKQSHGALSFQSIKIIDCLIEMEKMPEFKLYVKQGFYVEKKKYIGETSYKSF